MSLDVTSFDHQMTLAIRQFWHAREEAKERQKERGISDQGNRSGVTAGKNLDGFIGMIREIIRKNGMPDSRIFSNSRLDTVVPGYFRPTKQWDVVVVNNRQLIAAIELKSQVGPSFGNNFNNRVEEAVGNAVDILRAFREGAFRPSHKPFLGFLFVLEDCPASLKTLRCPSPHFPIFPEFLSVGYAERYKLLCEKLVYEQLYDSAALVLTKRANARDGKYLCLNEQTSIQRFISILAGRIAAHTIEETIS